MMRRRESGCVGCSIRTGLMGLIALLIVVIMIYALLPSPNLGGSLSGLNPQPTSTIVPGPTVLQAIQRQAKLQTIEMVIAKDITIVREHGLLGACTEQITYLAYFKVRAGVDLQKITQSSMVITADGYPERASGTIVLPDAELLGTELDTMNSKIVAQDTPKWVPGCSHEIADMTLEAQQKLQAMVTQDALEQGILSQAQVQAARELDDFLAETGYRNVTIKNKAGVELR